MATEEAVLPEIAEDEDCPLAGDGDFDDFDPFIGDGQEVA